MREGFNANPDGSFESVFIVPYIPYGPKTVRLISNTSQLNTVGVRVVSHVASITPQSGTDGTQIFLVGHGFDKNEVVSIALNDSTPINTGISASNQGSVNISFNIPEPSGLSSGNVKVTAQTINTNASINFIFSSVNSVNGGRLTITENVQAKIGDQVKIRGQDYPSQTNI